ncbi:hypothetical protein B0I35DRAFT_446894 [Stachybotrys elegans]|uniref:NADH:flavin oxidoreductase/NADH oxidase N-terminal domain-containing protein n=1 Tax=Stachybotrys elegans TaxID=80388 RepID=A0A8K0SCR6_9HYPO|nr:hypothetical protein B0I35DRAFT_446894 [Stachybotrys elegans]
MTTRQVEPFLNQANIIETAIVKAATPYNKMTEQPSLGSMASSRLFKPTNLGPTQLQHRIGMPTMTRMRNLDNHVATPLQIEYYKQRAAAAPGTLMFVESLAVAPNHTGMANAGAIWSEEQVDAWKRVTDAVHAEGSPIFAQLFAFGRAADPAVVKQKGFDVIGPSAIPISHEGTGKDSAEIPGTESSRPTPRAMSVQEIHQTVQDYAQAARNARRAGFDGVEIMAGYGYLLDEFLQEVSNQRQDAYGGSVENRSRLLDEIMAAVAEAVGPERVGIRLSPWSNFQGMGMADPVPQFSDIVLKAKRLGLGFIHLIEARVSGFDDTQSRETLDFMYDLWKGGTFLIAGGYTPELARELVDDKYPDMNMIVMFGRYFTSNPDLVFRVRHGVPLTHYRRDRFYVPGTLQGTEEGYLTFPLSDEFLASQSS